MASSWNVRSATAQSDTWFSGIKAGPEAREHIATMSAVDQCVGFETCLCTASEFRSRYVKVDALFVGCTPRIFSQWNSRVKRAHHCTRTQFSEVITDNYQEFSYVRTAEVAARLARRCGAK